MLQGWSGHAVALKDGPGPVRYRRGKRNCFLILLPPMKLPVPHGQRPGTGSFYRRLVQESNDTAAFIQSTCAPPPEASTAVW